MPNPDSRTKVITIRLSETEYAVLRARHRAYGARNVSDLARLALGRLLASHSSRDGGLSAKIADLDGRLQALESQLQVANSLFSPSPTVTGDEPL